MDHDLLILVAQANFAVGRAIRQNRLEDADRWSKLMERYARSLNALRRYRDYVEDREAKQAAARRKR